MFGGNGEERILEARPSGDQTVRGHHLVAETAKGQKEENMRGRRGERINSQLAGATEEFQAPQKKANGVQNACVPTVLS